VQQGIESPDPVFSCSIEAPSAASNTRFEEALSELSIEDPSLRIRQDPETGQKIIEGQGELHIEVIKERLKREYKLNVFMGPLMIGYREILNEPTEHTSFVEDFFGEEREKQWCSLRLRLEPTKKITKFKGVIVSVDDTDEGTPRIVRPSWIKAINEGCQLALFNGPVLGFPVCNLNITLKSLTSSGSRISLALLNACASRCLKEGMENAGTSLLEPVMSIEVTLICDDRGDLHSSAVLHELSQRRASIEKIDQDNYGHLIVIHAKLPLSESRGIANKIRSLSSGMCSLHMSHSDWQYVSEEEQVKILERRAM